MIAIMINSDGTVVGAYPDYTDDVELGFDFVLTDALPEVFVDLPGGWAVKHVNGDFVKFELPVIEPPEDKIARLEAELANAKAETASIRQDVADQTAAILDIYDIIGGV